MEIRSKFKVTRLENPRGNFIRTTAFGSVTSDEFLSVASNGR